MKVYGKCKECKNEIGFWTYSGTRVDMAMNHGETKTLRCKNCGTHNEFHVDELTAKESKMARIIAGLILIIGTPLLFFIIPLILTRSSSHYTYFIVGGFLLVPVVVYQLIRKQDQERVSAFNRHKLKGRNPNK